ncbi:tripeptidyl-peptidase-like protein [Elsinoe ampelina]|uniref:tripeptidyl-peptidase II n=1 Tax=Elsinoe ampelina TaxID=302913 RepID=A0A6A6G8I2_9PEZI|nr:tripeptidyl-peptidase-like protein [Elsinoe ampelina]
MEALRAVPQGWSEVGKPDPALKLHFRIAMHQPNEGLFEQSLLEVSDPFHHRYGQHLKREELKELLRPYPHASDAVLEWLQTSGISSEYIVDDGEWINFYANVTMAEQLLDTTFKVYRSDYKQLDKIRALQYSVPSKLHGYVDMIQPTTRFGEVRPMYNQVFEVEDLGPAGSNPPPLNATFCNTTITPDCLKALYKVRDIPGLDLSKTGFLGINGFLEQYARYDDYEQFASIYAPYLFGSNFTYQLINGGLNDQNSLNNSVEANLDAQYGLALSFPVNATYYSTGGRGPLVPDLDQPTLADNQNEPYLDFLTYIINQPDDELPTTLTTSYGENEQSVPEAYNRRVCSLFGQLGARGVSVLFSSGDTGPGSACQTNDGKNTTRFNPIFPASCPYLTSVGGTVGIPERAVSFSSGGFSDRFPRPDYQRAAVSRYLDILGDRFSGLYNRKGRGFPDVAAQGRGFRVIDSGRDISVGGTSASSPTFAGIIALLNAGRKSKGLPTLGFLNPFLYSKGVNALNDIALGGSTGCTGRDIFSGLPTPFIPFAGWNATKGWDPVTGLGTPDFEKLLKLVVPGKH